MAEKQTSKAADGGPLAASHRQGPTGRREDAFSNVLARGIHKPTEETKEKLEALRAQVDATPNLQRLAHGSSLADTAKERRDILRADDANPNLSSLSDKQKRALENRRKHRSKVHIARMEKHETRRLEAAVAAAQAQEILETTHSGVIEAENDMEATHKLTQVELKRDHLDKQAAKHIFDLTLTESAPYGMKYDRSGRYSILYGEKGHLAVMDNQHQALLNEFNVRERVRDACFLHNFTLMAAAQKNNVFIYDHKGTEVHRLPDEINPLALDFLPYHWLLVTVGRSPWINYRDTSTGEFVATHQTGVPCNVLRQNPSNAIMHVGHVNGTVTLWSPSSKEYLAKILCHKAAAVTSIAIDQSGHTMVTGGSDRCIKFWDLRTFQELHGYTCVAGPPTSLDISQRGLLAVGHAGHVTIWPSESLQTRVPRPYMHQLYPRCSPIETVRFRPFEDVCGVGHARGVSSMVVPGSGEPQIDTFEHDLNPHQDSKQRREAEVRALLEKLQPEMIALDPDQVGGIEASDHHTRLERVQDREDEANAKRKPAKRPSNVKRGVSKIQVQMRRKDRAVETENRRLLREAREEARKKRAEASDDEDENDDAPPALKRFFK